MCNHVRAIRDYDGCEIGPEIRLTDNSRFLAKTDEGIYALTPEDMRHLTRVVNLALFVRVLGGAILLACLILFVAELRFLAELAPESILPESGALSPAFFVTALLAHLVHDVGWQQIVRYGFSRIYRQRERLGVENHEDILRKWDSAAAVGRELPYAGRIRMVNIGERVVMVCILTVGVVWNLIDEFVQHSQDGSPYSIGGLYVLPCVLIAYYALSVVRVRDELRRGESA